MRIAMYTHSLNPRGGVVHALSLSEALQSLGHHVTLVAPAKPGEMLFRETGVNTSFFPAAEVDGGLADLVRQRAAEFGEWIAKHGNDFDLHHAHDGMSGYAVSRARQHGQIDRFVRTVHHLDEFADPFLHDAQQQSIAAADALLCVSRLWAERLWQNHRGTGFQPVMSDANSPHGLETRATVVGNGVDLDRFTALPRDGDRAVCESLAGPLPGPVVLCVGGIEKRKNTVAATRAFLLAKPHLPAGATLVIVGGATLLDHSAEREQFDRLLAGEPLKRAVRVTGPVPDSAMPALYRTADVLLFPSLVEGFGLAVLEAMACGTLVVTSRRAPFTEYLTDADAVLVDPTEPASIAVGLRDAFDPRQSAERIKRGHEVAARFSWLACAQRCAAVYESLLKSGATYARNAFHGSLAG